MEYTCFELDEIDLMLLDVFSEIGCVVLSCETVGVVTIWKQQHFHVHSSSEEHVGTSQGGVNTCIVSVVK